MAPRSILSLGCSVTVFVADKVVLIIGVDCSIAFSSLVIVFVETTVAPAGIKGLFNLGFAWIVGRRITGLNLLKADQPKN